MLPKKRLVVGYDTAGNLIEVGYNIIDSVDLAVYARPGTV
jgi:hypothetical protein